ncbi:bis(5'-nucleosyl)-tetraphosphatase (symmetrical) YqeK [Hespellia stercorisuis]|uniref:bis(5'-nucleosyl)-tetraphosphatase (symmetrical) n=1 Tax=Hespellia stercorisuis DSM 15480 TaxID=1121950 RepID=A0A1M6N214_9FIRM|nr:bis(5'-nucleosyl)-tetraphosphatase (symmetrical) YqeK [Hespellia stercorisuis]SHJ89686.1 putative HD superfamily hydrolase of NAD metabolism [Hespellia stercorisuis DSM 15480]
MTDIHKIRLELETILKKDRYEHTLGVMYTAASLAMLYEVDLNKALLAGLLHDCGKYAPNKDQVRIAQEYGIELTDAERAIPALIHAKLGAYLAEHKYGVEDREILNAIVCHTTGRANMTKLERILYISDYIEPGRDRDSRLPAIRKMAFTNLDRAVAMVSEATLDFLKRTGREVDGSTEETYQYYKNKKQSYNHKKRRWYQDK